VWQNARAANRLRLAASAAQLRVRLDFLFLASVKNQEQTISDLVHAAKQEDQHAFRQLLDLHWNELYGFMIKRTENENDAEDLCLQAFSKAFDKIETYNDEFTFSTWLTSIAKNLHVDLIRKKKTRLHQSADVDEVGRDVIDETLGPEDQLIRSQNLDKLLQQVRSLKPIYRDVIQLRFFQELSHKEMATRLGLSLSNVKVRLLRAKKLLSEIINDK
jgi:RNA polymerase sigma-70 factor (ECF subfamily)